MVMRFSSRSTLTRMFWAAIADSLLSFSLPSSVRAGHGLGGMRQHLEARQPEETASALDGVYQAEDVPEQLGVVRVLLELHEFAVQHRDVFIRLGQKFAEQVVHFLVLGGSQARVPGARAHACKCLKNAENALRSS